MEFWKEIVCKTGEQAAVEVKTNPTTGYLWRCTDDGGLDVESEYIPDRAAEGIVGSGGRQVFRLRSDVPGEFIVKLSHGRPWEFVALEEKIVKITFE